MIFFFRFSFFFKKNEISFSSGVPSDFGQICTVDRDSAFPAPGLACQHHPGAFTRHFLCQSINQLFMLIIKNNTKTSEYTFEEVRIEYGIKNTQQSINQSSNRSINRSINQASNQLYEQSIDQLINQLTFLVWWDEDGKWNVEKNEGVRRNVWKIESEENWRGKWFLGCFLGFRWPPSPRWPTVLPAPIRTRVAVTRPSFTCIWLRSSCWASRFSSNCDICIKWSWWRCSSPSTASSPRGFNATSLTPTTLVLPSLWTLYRQYFFSDTFFRKRKSTQNRRIWWQESVPDEVRVVLYAHRHPHGALLAQSFREWKSAKCSSIRPTLLYFDTSVSFPSQTEVTSRLLFVWKKESDTQKEQVGELRRKNEELVYNILPRHVAKVFLTRNLESEVSNPFIPHPFSPIPIPFLEKKILKFFLKFFFENFFWKFFFEIFLKFFSSFFRFFYF